MGLCVSGAALCAGRGRWFAGGVCSGLAFLDWQVGGVVGIALLGG